MDFLTHDAASDIEKLTGVSIEYINTAIGDKEMRPSH